MDTDCSQIIKQTPAETLNYEIDWTTLTLGDDVINGSSYTLESPSDATISNLSFTNTTTTFTVSNMSANLLNGITILASTVGGLELSLTIPMLGIPVRYLGQG